jgi:hypothetical protein
LMPSEGEGIKITNQINYFGIRATEHDRRSGKV